MSNTIPSILQFILFFKLQKYRMHIVNEIICTRPGQWQNPLLFHTINVQSCMRYIRFQYIIWEAILL